MRVLVTGGGGFLGTAIVRRLKERGDEVVSFSRSHHPHLEQLGVAQIAGDLCDSHAIFQACRACDLLFHVAAKPPPWGSRQDYDAINIDGTQHVIDACRTQNVPALVYTSTPSVVTADHDIVGGDERLPYGTHFFGADYPRTKAEAERRVLGADGSALENGGVLRSTALRPHLIWGPGDPHFLPRFVAQKRSGKLKRIGRRDPQVATTYIDNAADAHLRAADQLLAGAPVHGKAYFVTDEERIGLWSMLDRMLEAAGEGPVQGRVSAGVARFAAGLIEGTWRVLGLRSEPRLTRFLVHQVTTEHWFNISAAREELGYIPRVSQEEGLARLRAWCEGTQVS